MIENHIVDIGPNLRDIIKALFAFIVILTFGMAILGNPFKRDK